MKPARPVCEAASYQVHGFTLIELLVTVAVIGVLAGLLLPALSIARARGHAISCVNNQRQLMLASLLYVDEHHDRFPYNLGEDEMKPLITQGRLMNWANNILNWELDSDNTNTAQLLAGGIGPYFSGKASAYRCPADTVLSDLQRNAGWAARVRSMSMNAMVGDAGEFTTSGTNVNNPYYKQFFLLSQIPDPTHLFVLIEEHPDSVNDGYFLNQPASYEWRDLPASYHQGGANLAFADGHVESRRWVNGGTRRPARPDGAPLPLRVTAGERQDFYWLMERSTRPSGYSYPSR